MKHKRYFLQFSIAVAVLAIAAPALAGSFSAGPLVPVSGRSPFTGCTADGAAGQSGTVYMHSEVEPWVDVNPTNPANLVGIWQQDRWSNGGARGLVAGASLDGGTSWTIVPIPGVSLCSGGSYQRATDPWVSFGPDGTVHQLALVFNDFNFDNALLASKSTDGGLTWSQPVEVILDTAPTVFNDKQSITADPYDPDLVYAVWDRLVYPNENANVKAAFHAYASYGPAWFARSTDGGDTWEAPRPIYDPGRNNGTIGHEIVVLPNGDLIDIFNLSYYKTNRHKLRGDHVTVIRSTDKGQTWSEPILIDRLGTRFIWDPETGEYIRTQDILPEIAVDPNSGALYATWQDARFSNNQYDSIALSISIDGGFTWSTPVKVNATSMNLPATSQQAFTPSVTVNGDGTVAVTYYDFRNETSDPNTLLTDYFSVHCHPGGDPLSCANPVNWGSELRLTDSSFDHRLAPNAGGLFLGDYEGLAAFGADFFAFFSQTHGSDPSSVFFRRFGP